MPACDPAITVAQCTAVRVKLIRLDLDYFAQESTPEAKAARTQYEAMQAEIEARSPSPEEIMASQCKDMQANLYFLQRRKNPAAGEIVTPEEAASLPIEIEKTERYIAANCQ